MSTQIDLKSLWSDLKEWSRAANQKAQPDAIYVFGSLTYKDGSKFGASSDVDLVLKIPKSINDALARSQWLIDFLPLKLDLEQRLIICLGKTQVSPVASIVPVTDFEIGCDIHKDNIREFFSQNCFRQIPSDDMSEGLASSGQTIDRGRLIFSCLGYVQKVRHEYLAIASNNRRELSAFAGEDPLPKPLMRAAAMAEALSNATTNAAPAGVEYDVQSGLDVLCNTVYHLRNNSSRFAELNDLISQRRGGRGPGGSISPDDQLLLGELVYDIATQNLPNISPTTPLGVDQTIVSSINAQVLQPEPAASRANEPEDIAETDEIQHEMRFEDSLTFFYTRFTSAFPGVRKIEWFDEPNEAIIRLEELLATPLRIKYSTPIWWWRGGNLHIQQFERVSDDIALMDYQELKIRRIAAVPGRNYKRCFVYVETSPMEPTGLYPVDDEYIRRNVSNFGYADEEYGIFGEMQLTRGEFDDGAKFADGKLIKTTGSKLRVRYLTPYNFIVAAHASPINNHQFDATLEESLNSILRDLPSANNVIKKLSEAIDRLPLSVKDL